MYGTEAMNSDIQHPNARMEDNNEEDDVVPSGGDSLDNSRIRYQAATHALQNGGAVGPPANGSEDGHHHQMFVPGPEIVQAAGGGGAYQLTLSFQGEVCVFDAVSPEKGGNYLPARSNQPQRAASLIRFREKRKERCFDKKIHYEVRKEVAIRMQRKKGQFSSSKATSDEVGSASLEWNASSGQEEQETSCRHCGISSKSTPMMRRGPDGPRSLCNACGLKWANKGVLRDLSKVPAAGLQDPNLKTADQDDGEAHTSDDVTAVADVITSNGDNSASTADGN